MNILTIYSNGELNNTFITINGRLIDNLVEILISLTQKDALIRVCLLDRGKTIVLKSTTEINDYFSDYTATDNEEFIEYDKIELISQKNDSLISVKFNDENLNNLCKLYIHLKSVLANGMEKEKTALEDVELFVSYIHQLGFGKKIKIKNLFPLKY